jgi:YVTN family beta-propeller protein
MASVQRVHRRFMKRLLYSEVRERKFRMKKVLMVVLITAAAFAAEGYHVINKIKVGGTGGWDYLTLDNASRRLYVSHGNQVEVVDVDKGEKVGAIAETPGVHGIAIASEFNKGFISSRGANAAIVFDLKTLAKTGQVKTGTNPDSICYEPKTKRIFTFNGSSNDSTAIDAASNQVVKTFAVGPKPEFCVVDGAGKIYVNIEDSSEVVEIDAATTAVTRRASLAPCDGPSGLAIDVKNRKLFSVCGNKMMAVTDIATMKVIATPAIGTGTDGAGFDSGLGLAFSSNGGDGTMSVVKLVNGKYTTVETTPTERGARTMTVDEKLHRVYASAAETGAPPAGGGRAQPVPDSFHIVVVGK